MLICCTKMFSTVEPLSFSHNYHPFFPILRKIAHISIIISDAFSFSVTFLRQSFRIPGPDPHYSWNDHFQGEKSECNVVFLECTVVPRIYQVWNDSNMIFLAHTIAITCLC